MNLRLSFVFLVSASLWLSACSQPSMPRDASSTDAVSNETSVDEGSMDATSDSARVDDAWDAWMDTVSDRAPVTDVGMNETTESGSDAGGDGLVVFDARSVTDSASDADATATPIDAGGRCGDGVADRTYDTTTGWFREECDEGSQNGRGSCGTDCRFRPCGAGRLCPPLRSTFLYGLGGDHANLARYLLLLKEQGYNEVIFLGVGVQRWAYSGGMFRVVEETSSGLDVSARLVEVAERAGMGVIVGLMTISVITPGYYDWQIWPVPSRWAEAVRFSLDLAARIAERSGRSPAFRGFYIPQEMDVVGQRAARSPGWDPVGYYAELIRGGNGRLGLRQLAGPGRLVTISPYLHAIESDGSGNVVRVHAPDSVASDVVFIVDTLASAGGVDRVMIQDGVPKGWTRVENCDGPGQPPCLSRYFRAMQTALGPSRARVLWANVETYQWPPDTTNCYLDTPARADRVNLQVRATGAVVGGLTQWIHRYTFMASVGNADCDARRDALGRAYVTMPFPTELFALDVSGRRAMFLRGYHLDYRGTVRIQCRTSSGTDGTFTIRNDVSDPRHRYYNPAFATLAGPVVELSFWRPPECVVGTDLRVQYENPGGVSSVPWIGGW